MYGSPSASPLVAWLEGEIIRLNEGGRFVVRNNAEDLGSVGGFRWFSINEGELHTYQVVPPKGGPRRLKAGDRVTFQVHRRSAPLIIGATFIYPEQAYNLVPQVVTSSMILREALALVKSDYADSIGGADMAS